MISGGDLLVQTLIQLGAKKGFGVPGESYLPVLDAFYEHSENFNFIGCRNEGGASFMASAYGKLTGQPGLCFVTRGPGATNASIGVHSSLQDSSPMILFVGQVGQSLKGREAFQEVDYSAFFTPLAKWAAEINSADRIPEILNRAWKTATSGRQGPVVIGLPEDVLTSKVTQPSKFRRPIITEAAPTHEAIVSIQEHLEAAHKPLVIAGGSGWTKEGRDNLETFAEQANLPVLVSFRRHDLFDNTHPNFVGDAGVGMQPAVRSLIEDADCILAINIRFGEMVMDAYSILPVPNAGKPLVHIHPSDLELGKVYTPDLAVHAGPNQMSKSLSKLEVNGDWAEWTSDARKDYVSRLMAPMQMGSVDMSAIMKHLSSELEDDAIITNGAGNFAIWPSRHLPISKNMRLLAPQSGSMGYGLPAAIMAKSVHPDRQVICFAGDGDLQMNIQELGSAMQSGAQPIILLINNCSYGTIRMHQELTFPDRVSGTKIENPDFVALTKSYGFHAEDVNQTSDFKDAFKRARASKTGALLNIKIDVDNLTPTLTLEKAKTLGQA